MITVQRRGNGGLQKAIAVLERSNLRVKVGLIAGQGGDAVHAGSGLTNAELGALHENGSPGGRIVPRPWLAPSIKKGLPGLVNVIRAGAKQLLSGAITPEVLLGRVGARAAADAQNFITAGEVQPDIKVATMRRKGSWIALQATGQMKRAITWAVEQLS